MHGVVRSHAQTDQVPGAVSPLRVILSRPDVMDDCCGDPLAVPGRLPAITSVPAEDHLAQMPPALVFAAVVKHGITPGKQKVPAPGTALAILGAGTKAQALARY